MSILNTYPVFEADQVLTNDHLNNLFNYLEQQGRLTRNKLIGCGIVCGLEITYTGSSIIVSKGCAITSQGYLLTMGNAREKNCDTIFTHYIPYTQPALPGGINYINQCGNGVIGSIPFYRTDNSEASLFELTSFESAGAIEEAGGIALSDRQFLLDYVVVLFLEAENVNLKNCDTNDCNDKGSRMNFEVKALLVPKEFFVNEREAVVNESPLHHLELRRYHVRTSQSTLHSATAVLQGFESLVDDVTLSKLTDNLNHSWQQYRYLLKDEASNPFQGIDLNAYFNNIRSNNPVLLQYFYDFIDDLIKALYEFRNKVFDVAGECCPGEMRFPFTIKLGEAVIDTHLAYHSPYREYFIYSPLFDAQGRKLDEIRSLFTRLKKMVQEVLFKGTLPDSKDLQGDKVKVTPSRFGGAYLSERCIPYYYDAKELFPWWNYNKTRRGHAGFNQCYSAHEYAPDNPFVTDPLSFDIEKYDFFRIEGHIGKQVNSALSAVISLKQEYNLPFDVIALNADSIGTILRGEEPQCIIEDLESDYRVLIAELICKLHDSFCPVYQFGYKPTNITVMNPAISAAVLGISASASASAAATTAAAGATTAINTEDDDEVITLMRNMDISKLKIDDTDISKLVNEFQFTKAYKKGTFLKSLCGVRANSIGEAYLRNVSPTSGVFMFPVFETNRVKAASLYTRFFGLIDSIENMFSILVNNELSELNIDQFKRAYNSYEKQVRDLYKPLSTITNKVEIFLSTCIVAKLEALISEYNRRTAEYRKAKSFSYYFSTHGGVEHKAGVPRGGTFILVYHEKKGDKYYDPGALFRNKKLGTLMVSRFPDLFKSSVKLENIETVTKEIHDASYYKDPEQFLVFKEATFKFLDECHDIKPEAKEAIKARLNLPPPRERFNLENGMVIADFYVPYLCCSDCPPVAYILPPPPKEETATPTLAIEAGVICSGREGRFLLTVNPKRGVFIVDNGAAGHIQLQGDDYYFLPKGLSAGSHLIKYEVNGKHANPLQVEILLSPEAEFSYDTKISDNKLRIILTDKSRNVTQQTTYTWLLNGNVTQPVADGSKWIISMPVPQSPPIVLLKVSNGACPSEYKEEIVISREAEIIKMTTCRNNETVKLEPSNTLPIEDIETDAQVLNKKIVHLKLKDPASPGKTEFFVKYTLPDGKRKETTINTVLPDTGFTMELRQSESPTNRVTTLTLRSTSAPLVRSAWSVVSGGNTVQDVRDGVAIIFSANHLTPGTTIVIVHDAEIDTTTGGCSDKSKPYKLTRSIMSDRMNKGPFDNNFQLP